MTQIDPLTLYFANEMGRAQYEAADMDYPGLGEVPSDAQRNLVLAAQELMSVFVVIPFAGLPEVLSLDKDTGTAVVSRNNGLSHHKVNSPEEHVREALLHLALADVDTGEDDE